MPNNRDTKVNVTMIMVIRRYAIICTCYR